MSLSRDDLQNYPEILKLRTQNCKVYTSPEGLIYLFFTKNIHYKEYNGTEWLDINPVLKESGGVYKFNENKYTITFNKNGSSKKYITIHRTGHDNFKMETDYYSIKIDGKSINIPNTLSTTTYTNRVENYINDYLSMCTLFSDLNVTASLKSNRRIYDFEIILRLYLKNLTIDNSYQIINGIKTYIPDSNNQFTFSSDEEAKTLWISSPKMWNDDSVSYDIDHTLYEVDGQLYYKKTPNTIGSRWLYNAKPTLYIDANTYYSTTSDGYVRNTNSNWSTCRSATTGNEVNTTATSATNGICGAYASKNYNIARSFYYFNTSGINPHSWVQKIELGIYGAANGGYTSNSACCMKGTQADTLTTSDFASFSGNEYAYVSSWNASAYNIFTFNNQGILDLNRNGITKICVRERAHDYNNSTPTTTDGVNGEVYADNSGTSQDPYLAVYLVPANAPFYGMNM